MRELSLFTGGGGGILGSKLLGWNTVGYVEWNKYCQKIIRQRIADGIFDNAPIFGDIRLFISEGYAEQYRGMVDIITGGFPCQPFSVAGKQLKENDERNMWPETARCIRIIRPGIAYCENVTGLLSSGYFETILCDFHEMGYNVRWCVLSASNVGAPHKRDRLWILAYSKLYTDVSNTQGFGLQGERSVGFEKSNQNEQEAVFVRRSSDGKLWPIEPCVDRVVNGMANRSHRIKALGNGQVPLTMATAFQILSEGII